MDDHYGMADLRQFMSNTSFFTSLPPPQQQPSSADMLLTHHYEMVLAAPHRPTTGLHHQFFADSSTNATTGSGGGGGGSSGGGAGFSGLELETTVVGGGGGVHGFDGSGSGRWPRQETLTLLEIRSRLDSKFKEANHKGPLWDEVSRIMSEEHGYRRTGKKCREKFENLYKYYKKTKDGKGGRQDGKHYRFFRQLEALYGNNGSDHQTNNHNGSSDYMMTQNHHHQTDSGGNATFYGSKHLAADDCSLSLSKCSDFGSTSSGEEEEDVTAGDSTGENERKRKGRRRRRWKLKVKEFIDDKMRKLIEKQDEWLERMMSGIEEKEQERMAREEEWRKQEVDRMEREQRFWANERAWIEARDAAMLEALHKLGGNNHNNNNNNKAPAPPAAVDDDVTAFHDQNWATPASTAGDSSTHHHHEISKLIQLRADMESRFQQHIGCSDDALWEEIATKMSHVGYDNSAAAASMCRDKWLSINNYFLNKGNYKKRKENNISSGDCFNYNLFHNNVVSGSFSADHHHHHLHHDQQQPHDDNNNHPNSLRFLMGDNSSNAENMWEGYEELKQENKGAE